MINNAELTREIMKLAIADSGLSTTDFLTAELIGAMTQEHFEQLKRRAVEGIGGGNLDK